MGILSSEIYYCVYAKVNCMTFCIPNLVKSAHSSLPHAQSK